MNEVGRFSQSDQGKSFWKAISQTNKIYHTSEEHRTTASVIISCLQRNTTKFFKDRHWTSREFHELVPKEDAASDSKRKLLEVGCGVGNFVFPLLEEPDNDLFVYCCDFSARAVQMVTENPNYSEDKIRAFQVSFWLS